MITELAPYALAAATALTGFIVGRLAQRRRPTPPAMPRPICPCGHVISMHEDGPDGEPHAGACTEEEEREHYYSNGSRNGYEWVQCRCRRYTGPELVTGSFLRPFTAREITTEEL